MDKSKHNLRSNFLFLLLAISSFSLFAQKETNTNSATINKNDRQTNTVQIQTNTSSTNGRLILQASTTSAYETPVITSGGLEIDNGSTYSDNIHTSAGGDLSSGSNQTVTVVNCPMMYVQVTIPFLQSCVSSSAQIDFCNNGTATAFGAFVDVQLPAELVLDSADLPYTNVAVNLYRFQLGTVAMAFCDQFEIYLTPNCDSTLIGEEHCIDAHIYPDTLCNSIQNTPLITLEGNCTAGKTTFTLKNHGTAVTFDQHMQLIVIDDHLIAGGGILTTYLDDTLEVERGAPFIRGFTPGTSSSNHNDYKLTLKDGSGNLLVSSTVHDCYIGSSTVEIHDFHMQQYLDQFSNGGILPSIAQGCAVNGNSSTQTNSIHTPSTNTSNTNNENSNQEDATKLDALDTKVTTVQVFPNPFSQYATVRIDGPISDQFIFRLYDVMGKTVQMIEIEEQREFQIERGDLLQGMYMYHVESKGHLIGSGKLIIR